MIHKKRDAHGGPAELILTHGSPAALILTCGIDLGYSGLFGRDHFLRTHSVAQVHPEILVLAAGTLTKCLVFLLPSLPDSAHYDRVAQHWPVSHSLFRAWRFMGNEGFLFSILDWRNGNQTTFSFLFLQYLLPAVPAAAIK